MFPKSISFLCALLTSLLQFSSAAEETARSKQLRAAATVEAKKFDVGGRSLLMRRQGAGHPTIVIEPGLGEPGVETGSWKTVVDELSKSNLVILYDRAGLGKSDPAPTPRTASHMAIDLKNLLTNANVPGPYILLGHSIGGFIVRSFADKYPNDVAAIAFIDSSHPNQWAEWLKALPKERPNEPKSIGESRKFLTSMQSDPASNPEKINIAETSAELLKSPHLGGIAITIVTHSPKWRMVPDLPEPISVELENIWQNFQRGMLDLSTNSAQVISATAGHYVQAEDPKLVIEAVQKLIARTQNQKPHAPK